MTRAALFLSTALLLLAAGACLALGSLDAGLVALLAAAVTGRGAWVVER